jgi:rare lipoprotein A
VKNGETLKRWAVVAALSLWGCASHRPAGQGRRSVPDWYPPPALDPAAVYQVGVASYYGKGFHGRRTASSDVFDQKGWTAAHLDMPFGTIIRVTNLENARHCIVKVNDRGPFAGGRILDLAEGAAQELEMIQGGTARVQIQIVKWPDRPP